MANLKIQTILAKIEATYGTDPTPTGAANAILVENLQVTPLDQNPVQVDYALAGFDKELSIPAEQVIRVSFDMDLTPNDAAKDVPPVVGPLLRACGLGETITATTSVTYFPIAQTFESVTLWPWIGATKHAVSGCRGTVRLDADAGKLPKLHFEFTGIYAAPGDVALPTPTYAGYLLPKPMNKANTQFTANAVSTLVLTNFSLDVANQIVFRDRPNYQSVDIDDRDPKGSFSFFQPALSAFNIFTLTNTPTAFQTSFIHTLAAGRSVSANAFKAQVEKPTYGADGNQRLVVAPFSARRNPTGSAFTLVYG